MDDARVEIIQQMIKDKLTDESFYANKKTEKSLMYMAYDYDNVCFYEPRNYKEIFGLQRESLKSRIKFLILNHYIKNNHNIGKTSGFPTSDGVYLFLIKSDFEMSINELFLPLTYIGIKNDNINYTLPFIPKVNIYKDDENINQTIKFKKGYVLYAGETQDIHSRYYEHMNADICAPTSLKLGLRIKLKENIDFVYIKIEKDKIEETITNIVKNYEQLIKRNYDDCESFLKDEIKKYTKAKFKTELESYIKKAYGVRFGK